MATIPDLVARGVMPAEVPNTASSSEPPMIPWPSHIPLQVPETSTPAGLGRLVVAQPVDQGDRKSTRLNSSHVRISYAVFCLKKKNERPVTSRPYAPPEHQSGWRPFGTCGAIS